MTCFGMIAAVSLEALFLPDPLLQHPPSSPYHPRQESGFFAISRMVTGFGIWGWMQFTMCLCFGMCVISFLLCDHEIYIARCQKCLWIASPPACAEKIIKLRAVIPPKSTSTRRGTNVTLCHDRNTPSCWSSVSSFRFASAKKKKKSWIICFLETPLPEWFVCLKVVIMSLQCLGKFSVRSWSD